MPPNKHTKPGNRHGVHYIKLFPIEKEYINKYVVSGKYYKTILNILDKKEPDIISSVKEYLAKCESGQKHSMTPNINGIIDMFNMLKEEKLESKKLQNNHRSSKSTALFLYLKSQYNPSNKIQIEDIVPCHTKVWGAAMLLST